jgi:DNA-binding Xre family transcriptional regulator
LGKICKALNYTTDEVMEFVFDDIEDGKKSEKIEKNSK